MSEHRTLIHIDDHEFHVPFTSATGDQLRHVPTPPIGPDFDLYEEGHQDLLIQSDVTYPLKDGMHFFTAPSNINPGCRQFAAS